MFEKATLRGDQIQVCMMCVFLVKEMFEKAEKVRAKQQNEIPKG
jgi:hypothetical protein